MEVVLHHFSLYLLVVPVFTWNIDTRIPVTFSGFKDSYFGFSVALHENSNGTFGLVSATRANSTLSVRKILHQPGVLYKCDITTSTCEEVILERTANNVSYVGRLMSYVAKEDDMWLGVSLDIQSWGEGNILTCGHLWKNQHYQKHYLTNGACYMIDREFRRESYKLILPLIQRDKQTIDSIYYYAFALAGMSAAFVEDDNSILLGAPGFHDWIGTVLSYTIHDDPRYSMVPVVPDPPFQQQLSPEAYIGYSVSAGKFFDYGNYQLVAGAPRDGNNIGRVYVIDSLHHNHRNFSVLHRFQGEKIGEYFGACVAGINVNGDSYTDLFIGSPFYSLPGGGDEGKVYVYISNGVIFVKHCELMGSKKPESRFGTTIGNAGDLNQDGFIDVAIGAPYEDGQGAVYIYHGTSKGINEQYIQRIAANEVNPLLSGFGISISKAKDIDDNHYPDILIGSYASDHAVLFRTRPIVKIFGNMVFNPPQIPPNSHTCKWNNNFVPCFNVSFCFKYVGNHVPNKLGVSTELTSARQKDNLQARRYLIHKGKLSSYLRQNITIAKDKLNCFSNPSYVVSDSNDFITPIQMKLTFKLTHDVTTEEKFCKLCPMLHPDLPTTIIKKINFQVGCGEDSICLSDLIVTVKVHGLSSGELIVGQDNVLTLSIELQNSKEPSYTTELFIYIPSEVQIINQDNCRESQDLSDLVTIVCQGGNPLVKGQMAKFEIKLDTSSVSTSLDHLIIKVNASTASREANPADNQVDVKIPLKLMADITIIGYPEKDPIMFKANESAVDVVHVYAVLKYLPSPINSVSVAILVPTTFVNNDLNFFQLKSVRINEGSSGSGVPASCNYSLIDPGTSEYENNQTVTTKDVLPDIPTPRPKRSIRKRSVNKETEVFDTSSRQSGRFANYVLDCTTSVCSRISCIAGPFTHKSFSVTFRVYGFVNITSLKTTLKNWDRITLVTEGKVTITDPKTNIQPAGHRPDETKVITTIEHPSLMQAKRIPIWIIVLSIVAGVLLLALISWGLIKLGFFRRKQKEDMEKMMMEEESEPCIEKESEKEDFTEDTR